MAVICSRPTTKESRKRHAETFGEDPLSRSRWLELAEPDESYRDWVERVSGVKSENGIVGWKGFELFKFDTGRLHELGAAMARKVLKGKRAT